MSRSPNNPSAATTPGQARTDARSLLDSGSTRAANTAGGDDANAAVDPAKAQAAALFTDLAEKPFNFDFFQAVRRLENAFPDKPRVGYSKRAADDPVRFCQQPSLAFAPATLSAFKPQTRPGEDGAPVPVAAAPWRLFVNFFGLCGPQGPMPMHITEYVRDRERNQGDPTAARFFDVFHHRLLSLFYRAWATNQQAVSHERMAAEERSADRAPRADGDRFAFYVASLVGLGMPELRRRDAVPDLAKLHYSGRLANQTKNAEGLRAIRGDYFGMPCDIEEFVGQWVELPPESGCRLGESRETGLLGQTTIVGSKVWDCQQRFRIRLGPMKFHQYQRLLPGGDSLRRLVAWVRNYVGDEFTWDVQLVLLAAETPRTQLGRLGQVGWSTWIGSRPRTKDADDLKLRPVAS